MTADEREEHRATKLCRLWGTFDYRCHACRRFDAEVVVQGVALAITTFDRQLLAGLRIRVPDELTEGR